MLARNLEKSSGSSSFHEATYFFLIFAATGFVVPLSLAPRTPAGLGKSHLVPTIVASAVIAGFGRGTGRRAGRVASITAAVVTVLLLFLSNGKIFC